jgi:hypothetical protein
VFGPCPALTPGLWPSMLPLRAKQWVELKAM